MKLSNKPSFCANKPACATKCKDVTRLHSISMIFFFKRKTILTVHPFVINNLMVYNLQDFSLQFLYIYFCLVFTYHYYNFLTLNQLAHIILFNNTL